MATTAKQLIELGVVPEVAKRITTTGAAAASIAPLTGAFGTPGNAIVAVGASFSQTTLNNNFRALEDKINAIIAALKA